MSKAFGEHRRRSTHLAQMDLQLKLTDAGTTSRAGCRSPRRGHMKTQVWLLSMIVMDNVCQGLLPKGEYHHWQVFFPLKEVFPAVSPLSPMSGY